MSPLHHFTRLDCEVRFGSSCFGVCYWPGEGEEPGQGEGEAFGCEFLFGGFVGLPARFEEGFEAEARQVG